MVLCILVNRVSLFLVCKLTLPLQLFSDISPTDDLFLYFPMTYLAALLSTLSIESICTLVSTGPVL